MGTELVPMLTDEQRDNIHDSRSPYSAEDRVCTIMAYIVAGGNSEEASRKASVAIGQPVHAGTIRQWKIRAAWWAEGEEIARKMLQQDLGRKYTKILHDTEKEIVDRIKNGDTVVTKMGIVKVPVKFRDLVTGHAIVSDKRAMLYGEPTSRKEDTGVALLLRLAKALQSDGEKKIGETVNAEFTEVKDEKFS